MHNVEIIYLTYLTYQKILNIELYIQSHIQMWGHKKLLHIKYPGLHTNNYIDNTQRKVIWDVQQTW